MLLSWIVKTIPRSWRALIALLVVLGSIGLAFSALQALFVPTEASQTWVVVRLVIGLAIGLPATAFFYYFQEMDDRKRHGKHELEILDNYMSAEQRDRIYKESRATPVFTSRQGAVRPKNVASASQKHNNK